MSGDYAKTSQEKKKVLKRRSKAPSTYVQVQFFFLFSPSLSSLIPGLFSVRRGEDYYRILILHRRGIAKSPQGEEWC